MDEWTDLSGSGSGSGDNISQNALLSDGGPTLVAGGVNGQPTVNYGGGGGHTYNGPLGISGTQAFSIFTVFKNESTAGNTADERIMQFGDITGTNAFRNVALDGNSPAFRYNNGNRIFNTNFSKTEFQLGQWTRAAGTTYSQANLAINSVTNTQASAGSPNNTASLVDEGYTLGRGTVNATGLPGNFLRGELAELLVYDRALNAGETDAVEFYLRHRYNLDFQAVTVPGVDNLSSSVSAAPVLDSTVEGEHESNGAASLFREAANLTLAADLDVNIKGAGTYSNGFDTTAGTVAAGTEVHSYFLNYDTGAGTLVTTFTMDFNNPIVGIISGNNSLLATHGSIGNAGTTYMTTGSGLEDNAEDVIIISPDGLSLSATLRVGTGFTDQLRILTLIPEPSSAGLVIMGAGLLAAFRRRRR